MVEKSEIHKTVVVEYDSIDEFVEVLKKSETPRVYTFFSGGVFGIGANWTASFIDDKEVVHGYTTLDVEDLNGHVQRVKPIYDTMQSKKIPEVDGIIKVSPRKGDVYHIFQADSQERNQDSYDRWLEAVKSLPVNGTLIQYLTDESFTIVDATRKKQHIATILDGKRKRTLEDTLKELKCYKTKDNKPVISWYMDIMNK